MARICEKHNQMYEDDQGCYRCLEERYEQLERDYARKGLLANLRRNWALYFVVLLFTPLILFAIRLDWANVFIILTLPVFMGLVLLWVSIGLSRSRISCLFNKWTLSVFMLLIGILNIYVYIGVVDKPTETSTIEQVSTQKGAEVVDQRETVDRPKTAYETTKPDTGKKSTGNESILSSELYPKATKSDGTKERPYKIGEVGRFRTYLPDDENAGTTEQSLVVNSVLTLPEVVQKLAETKGVEIEPDIFADFTAKIQNEGYEIVVVNITYTNLNNDRGSKLSYANFTSVADGKVKIMSGNELSDAGVRLYYGDLYGTLGLDLVDGTVVYRGGTVTGDIVLLVDIHDENPMLLYGNNVAWYSIRRR